MRRIGLLAAGLALVLIGAGLAHLVQTAGGVSVRDIRWTSPDGQEMSGLLYVPRSATVTQPAPAVLASHGYINSREMQSPFAIELARRGFVVLAMDMSGHGYSGGAVGDHDGGGPGALAYLRAQPFVDRRNIGLEGHSMGGVPIIGAALAQPDGYRSMVLEGSTVPEAGQVGAGTSVFPRNLEVVFGQYDEFAPLMWHEARGADVGQSPKMAALFGTTAPAIPGRLAGSIADGTARLLITPPVTHPMEHFSTAGVGAAVDWFQRTLTGEATPLPASDQIWFWKEVGTLMGLVGFVVVVLGAFDLALTARPFASLRRRASTGAPPPASPLQGWFAIAAAAILPAATFYALMGLGYAFTPSRLFPQYVTNQLVVWALVNAGVSAALLAASRRRGAPAGPWLPACLLALTAAAAGYAALFAVDRLFGVDFRFWVVGLKLLDARHAIDVVAYAPAFTLAYLVTMRSFNTSLPREGQGAIAAGLTSAAAMSLGFVVLLAVQYGALLTTGRLFSPKEALNTIIAIQFVPVLATVGVIGAFAYRRTGGYVAGGVLCGLLVSWYIVAGTATHWRPGWSPPHAAGLFPDRPATMRPPALRRLEAR